MLTIHVWPRWLKDFLLTHPLYKSPNGKLMGVFHVNNRKNTPLRQ